MTPSLAGRIQTRLLLLATVGLAVTAGFGGALGEVGPFLVLGWVGLLGIGWDLLWDALQSLRWDRDWPAAFQLAAGAVEGLAVFAAASSGWLPGTEQPEVALFAAHYAAVFLTTFVVAQGPLRVLAPRWRFRGGRLIPRRLPKRSSA